MKNLLLIMAFMVSLFTFTSCSADDDSTSNVNTYAKISVRINGQAESGISVYMFGSNKGPGTSFFIPLHSDKVVITESNGEATFNLQETYDLDIIDTQTTLYFGVFDNDDNLLGSTAITIQKGETKSSTINY